MRVSATFLLLLTLLVVPATAGAAKREVPRGWLGVVADGPLNDPAWAGGATEWDRMAGGEAALRPVLVVDGGEHVRVRPGVADRGEDALRAAQVEQEVVHESDAGRH